MLAYLANVLLFLIVGMTIGDVLFESAQTFKEADILYVFVTYIGKLKIGFPLATFSFIKSNKIKDQCNAI